MTDDSLKDNQQENQLKTINDYFPNEILEEILRQLILEIELCNAKLVCRRWKLIVDEMVGHSITVTNFDSLLKHLSYEDSKLMQIPTFLKNVDSLKKYPTLAIRHLTVGVPGMLISDSLTPMIEHITKEIGPFPNLAFAHVLKSLSIFEPVPSNLLSALGHLGNIKHLNISLLSFGHLTANVFQNVFTLRSLTTLVISETLSYPEFNSTLAISPLSNFLMHIKAPSLTSLEITYPIVSLLDVERDSTRHIMNLIRRSPFLKKLSIGVCSPNQNFLPPLKLFQYPKRLLEEMEDLGKLIKLESLELRDNHLHSLRPSVQTKAWIIFIKQQSKLRYLKLYLKSSIEFSQDVAGTLIKNATTLVDLDLSCFPCEIEDTGDVYFVPIDGRTLADCSILRTLKLADKTINTASFPRSLTYVYVDAMMTNVDAHNLLLADNPNLKRVELKDTRGGAPKGFGYGVTIDTLRQFVKKRSVQRLSIYAGSTDEKFPLEGIPNGDTVKPKRLRKRKVEAAQHLLSPLHDHPSNRLRIDWQLNEQGFYENVEYAICNNEGDEGDELTPHLHHPLFTSSNLITNFH